MVEKKNVPRTMENIFADGKCDNCGTAFGRRAEVWVSNEHTCCSRTCAVQAQKNGDAIANQVAVRDGSLL